MADTIFEQCYKSHGGEDGEALLMCVTNLMEAKASNYSHDLQQWLLVLSGSMVFFMQAGFAMVCAGAVRKKNVNNTLLKNTLDAIGAAIAFYTFGFGIAYGESNNGFVGGSHFFLSGNVESALFFYQYGCCATAATIVAGTLAERCQMVAYIFYSFFLTGFVYPVVARMIWSEQGYFSQSNEDAVIGNGVIDFAGTGVVHITGGSVALCATLILGPRKGRFTDKDGKVLKTPGLSKGNSIAFQALGTFILWFGWYGFNCGSSLLHETWSAGGVAAVVAVNTTIAAATAGICALFVDAKLNEQYEGEFCLNIVRAMNGTLAGLVAITGCCAVVDYWAAFVIGIIAGLLYLWVSNLLIKYHIDDAIDAIPVHLANGILGLFVGGLFTSPKKLLAAYGHEDNAGLFYGGGMILMGAQVVAILFILGWTFAIMCPFFKIIDHVGWFRVNELEEIVGLDATYNEDKLKEDHSEEEDEKEREAAYKKRFEEIQKKREKKTMRELYELPWGQIDLDSTNDTGSGYRDTSKHGNSRKQLATVEEIANVEEAPDDAISREDKTNELLSVLSMYE